MLRTRIIYRLVLVFLIFAALIIVPFSYTTIKQADKMISQEETARFSSNEVHGEMHRAFVSMLIDQLVPYVLYILIMSFILSVFFLRKMIISLKQIQRGSLELKNGNLDPKLKVISNDELGDATKAFNDMAASLREMALELRRKESYLNAMNDPLFVVNGDNNIVDVNPAFTKLLGYTREEIIGASMDDLIDDNNAGLLRSRSKIKEEKGSASVYEINCLARDGAQVPVLLSSSPIYSADGIAGRIGLLKDFREQNELRRELRRSKDYVETIMDSIEDQMMVIDSEYKIIRANKISLLNHKGPVIGEFCYSIAHGNKRPCWADGQDCPAQSVFLTGKNYRTTHEHTGIAGDRRFHEIVASPIMDSAGNVLQVIELIRDATDRMKHNEEMIRKNRELVALNSISGILSKSLRPDEIFVKVLDKIMEMMRMDGGWLFFLDDSKKEMQCQYHRGISDEFVKMMGRIRLGEDIPGKVAVTGEVMTTSDLSKDDRIERSIIKHSGIKGYCCIPIRGKEKIIGVFCLSSFRTHNFTSEEENILFSIGEMTGIALENIKLYEQMRELYESQRKRREDEQSQLLSLSLKLGSEIELRDIMGQVFEQIKGIFGADFAWLLVSDSENNLILKSATSAAGKENEVIYPRGVSSIEGYSIERRLPTSISDICDDSRFFKHPALSEMAYQSAISVPMYIGEKTIGVFSLYFIGLKELREEELHFLQIISNILAVSLERSDFYAEAIIEKGLSDTILQSVADGIITVDTGGRILSVNRAFEKMFGVSFSDVVGIPVCDVMRHHDNNTDFRIALAGCLESALERVRSSVEALLTTALDNKISVMISSAPILGADGNVAGVVNLIRDISREKEIDRMKTDIIRSVSHEFRTPLSAIVGMTEMILDGDVEGIQVREYLSTIISEGIRLSDMVSDLLSIARIEGGKEVMKFEHVDLVALLIALKESFSSLLEEKKADIRIDIDGVRYIIGDEEKIRQLLSNLIDNSLTFSDEGCIIDIRARKKEHDIEIIVSDNGWGIPSEDVPYLTERFFRGKHGEKVKGAGLGLFLCNEIIKMHGGKMNIESVPGAGTKVILSFPCKEVI